MKFQEMPYERVDIEQIKRDFAQLEKDFDLRRGAVCRTSEIL